MAAEIALVTANMGGIDPPFPLPEASGVASFYYTDRPGPAPMGWTKVPVSAPENPRLASKFFKCQIHRLPETARCAWLAWADASFQFHSLAFLPDWAPVIEEDRALFVPHPDRATVAEEYDYVLRQIAAGNPYLSARYTPGPLERERARFGSRYDLSALPLLSGGMWMLRRGERSDAFLDAWWACVNEFSVFDQAAIPPLLADHGIRPFRLGVNLYKNPHFTRVSHA